MANFYETVLTVLKSDERFVAEDGTFLRNAVYEAAMKMDEGLIRLLLANDETRTRFFAEVDGVKVFDKMGFAWIINNRQFLPDSYTRFKNKIGLVDGSEQMLATSGEVELVFPYKDCVLEGGQTREDQKRQEIFYNETLAPDEVDRLLYPKVFSGAKRYATDSTEDITQFSEMDNLIIKGNNLLVISSLLKRYEGRVKCVYIDPPYNPTSNARPLLRQRRIFSCRAGVHRRPGTIRPGSGAERIFEKSDLLRKRDCTGHLQNRTDEFVPPQHRRHLRNRPRYLGGCAVDRPRLPGGLRADQSALRKEVLHHLHQ